MIAGGALVANGLELGPPKALRLNAISQPLRLAVLALVLLRAGLGLSREELRSAGTRALLIGVVPMLCDAAAVAAAAHWLLELRISAAIVLGFLVAAISPAIVIPGLLTLLEALTGDRRRAPTALLAGAPLDNIFALLALGVALDLSLGGQLSWTGSLLLGGYKLGAGVLAGLALAWVLLRLPGVWGAAGDKPPPYGAAPIWIAGCLLLVAGREAQFSFVLAIIALGAGLRAGGSDSAKWLDQGLARIWSVAQYALFGLIGAAVDLAPLASVGLAAAAVICLGQLARALGCFAATAGSGYSLRERLGCVLCYLPKATIQAAFAGLALDRGMAEGELILSVGVLAIVITAPIGVIALHSGAARLFGVSPPAARESTSAPGS